MVGNLPMASLPRHATRDAAVLIAGGGPVGLTTALLLAKHGIVCTLIERRPPRVSSAPKAHVVNPRSLEIFKSLGVDLETLRQSGASRGDAEVSRFMTKLSGTELGHIPLDVGEHEAFKVTPTPLLNIAQPKLESFLAALVSENPRIDYRLGDAWVACRAVKRGVVGRTRFRAPFSSPLMAPTAVCVSFSIFQWTVFQRCVRVSRFISRPICVTSFATGPRFFTGYSTRRWRGPSSPTISIRPGSSR